MLKQKFLVQFGSNFFIKIFAIFASIIVARIAGPKVIGTVAYGIAYASMFTFITGIWGTPHIKLVSEGKPLVDCMGVFTRLKSASILLFIIVGSSWLLLQKYVLNNSFDNKEQEIVVWISLFVVAVHQCVNFLKTTFESNLQQVKSNLPELARGFLFQTGCIVVVVLGFRAIALVSWNLASALLIMPITIYFFKSIPIGNWNIELAKKYWAYAKPLILYMVIGVILKNMDKILLKRFANVTEIGYYAIAYTLGGMILLIGRQVGTIFFPLFSSNISKGNWEKINSMIFQYQEFIMLFIFPFICFLSLISKPLITTMYGENFLPSVTPFTILLFSSYILLFSLPFGNIVTGSGKFYWYTWITAIKALFFVVTLFVLISPKFFDLAAVGLAINNLFVNFIEAFLYIIASKKLFPSKIFYKKQFCYFLIGGIALIVVIVIKQFVFSFIITFVIGIAYLLLIYIILISFSIITIKHKKMILDIIDIKKLLCYVKSEIK